jgi:hypothetical protein
MKKSEKLLLTAFAVVFLLVIGGGFLSMGLNNYRAITAETEKLTEKLGSMASMLSQSGEWQTRSDWVDANLPKFGSHEEASSMLIQSVMKKAQDADLTIASKEMMPIELAKEGEALGYYDRASVKFVFNDVVETSLFKWMHSLHKDSKSFVGVSRMALTPSGKGKSVNCEVDVTQFYRESAPQKLSKAH